MDSIPSDVLALADKSAIVIHAAHRIETSNPLTPACVWSGYGDITIDSSGEVYKGLGATDLASPMTYAVNQSAEGVSIALSSLDTTFVPTVLAQDLRGRGIEIFRLWFNVTGVTLLHTQRVLLGTVDQLQTVEIPGGEAKVVFKIESEAQGSQRSGGRLASDQDQRRIDPADTAMRYITVSPELTMYWGALDPNRAGKVLNDGSTAQSARN